MLRVQRITQIRSCLRGHAEAPDADEAKMNAGRENGNPDVYHEADGFDEQDECGED